jgi:hypothetical protein
MKLERSKMANIPGFSAEDSLYRSNAYYQTSAMVGRLRVGQCHGERVTRSGTPAVQPAALSICRDYEFYCPLLDVCVLTCNDYEGGGDGGVNGGGDNCTWQCFSTGRGVRCVKDCQPSDGGINF